MWDFTEWDDAPENRTSLDYLFHTAQHTSRCYDASFWSKKVKAIFARYSPRKTPTPPRLLRSSFITCLRSDPDVGEEVLKSAAYVQKHCLDTSSSDVYDLEVHKKLQKASFDWTEAFAMAYEARLGPHQEVG